MHFSARLKAARKMNGFSLQDLSDALQQKLNKQALNRLETGEAKPDSKTIHLLGKALRVTSDYFFRTASVSLDDVKFRKLKKLPGKEQEKVIALTTEYLERYLELEDVLGIDNVIKFAWKGYKIKSRSDVEAAAEKIRSDWHLGEDPLHNIVEMLEENNIKVFQLSVDRAFSGMSTVIANKIAVIVLNNNNDIPLVRQRFTALHELAHLYMDLSAIQDEKECERLCDLFAGAVLLPAIKVKKYLGEKRSQIVMSELLMIEKQYGISSPAIMFRAISLNIVSASYMKFFMIRYNQLQINKKEFDLYKGKEHSDRFLRLLIRAVAEEIISTTKAASLYNQKLGDFRALLDTNT
jgi:Zn-dependent peptidase ImmA (M78 family)/DNA-binding XRE family transcriptional regulator